MKEVVLALPLRGMVLFPGMIRPVSVGRPASVAAIDGHVEHGAPLVFVVQRDPDHEDPLSAELSTTGVLGQVLRVTRMPDDTLRVLIEGTQRVRVQGPLKVRGDAGTVVVTPYPEHKDDPIAVAALAKHVAEHFDKVVLGQGVLPAEADVITADPSDPERLVDQICGQLDLRFAQRLELLETPSLHERLKLVINHLAVEEARQTIASDVNTRVQNAMDASQREYHLKEQLKAIRTELGEAVGPEADADMFSARIKAAGMPAEAEKEALREVERLRRLNGDSAEYTIARTWLETICDVPWSKSTTDTTDLGLAMRVLEEDHYGLEKVKERILEYLAVRQLKPDSKGPILCFVGPPGVGKTSLGRSIAKSLGRQYGRIALGGVKDETEVRGHRRTYIGALPGRILRGLIRAGSRNPVLVLDEIDKVGTDPMRGDPASALLEVLDGEQNSAFMDHYLDVPVDLSQVMFIATANLMDPIPAALLDRLEIIEIPGYIEEHKVEIARRHILPKLSDGHGLKSDGIQISAGALLHTIRDYTREAGLRDLERQLATLHRKVARQVVEGKTGTVKVSESAIRRYLGPPKFFQEVVERVDRPGVVVGLAWTAAGGDILFIESTKMPGNRSLKMTGSLGAVMKESAEAAMSWLRAHAGDLGIADSAFDAEFHLHVPAGAIPKDGPSAGITMATSLASLVTGRAVRARVAMTGEITLRGKVLPVGGVKEKVLAARRAGVKTVILPKHNQNDLDDIPGPLRRDLTFHFVEDIREVLELALVPAS